MQTADTVVQGLPWKWSVQGKIFTVGGLGLFFDAWDVTLPGFVIPLLAKYSGWGLSGGQLGLFGTIGLFGMGFGALFWGTIADLVGRKRAFALTILVYSIFTLACALAPTYGWLLTLRFLAGFGLGGCIPVDFLMISEFMPVRIRGLMTAGLDAWWPVGGTVNGLLATALLPLHNWRLLMLPMILPALFTVLVRTTIPESPLFLVRKGRREEADRVIGDLVQRTGGTVTEWTYATQPTGTQQLANFFSQLRDIWAWDWRVTLSMWGLWTTNLVLYFGVLTWLPQVLIKSGYSASTAFLSTVWVTAVGILGPFVAGWASEHVGRKWVVVTTGVVAALAMVIFTLNVQAPLAAKVWLGIFGFTNELVIPIVAAYTPEVYPTLLRGSGIGWASASARFASAFIPVIFGAWLWPVFGLTLTFVFIMALITLFSVFVAIVCPEMSGRGYEAVDAQQAAAASAPASR